MCAKKLKVENIMQAREQSIGRIMHQARDDEDKQMEIYNMVNGDFLTENSDTAISSFGPHRVVPDRWKGMSPAQIKSIRQQQLVQKEQRRVKKFYMFIFIYRITK
jgi:RIB43A